MERLISLLGLLMLLGIGYVFSKNRKQINWRTVGTGLGLQLLLGIILLKIPKTAYAFEWFTTKVTEFLKLAKVGALFVVYGDVAPQEERLGFIFGVEVGATIIFFSAFISILYYLGIIQVVIGGIAKIMRRTMGTSGTETLSCSANIFVGQTEAPFLIKPYIGEMTLSELHAVMVGGFATVAGGVLAAYIGMGISATHLIIASVMSAPAALVMAKMMVPETHHSITAGDVKLPKIKVGDNIIDAAAQGTTMGLKLALNVMAMLVAFIALIAFVDWVLGGIEYCIDYKLLGGEAIQVGRKIEYQGIFPGSLRTIFGTIFGPLAFLMGVPWHDAAPIGNLLGVKICANEFVAYGELSNLIKSQGVSPRSVVIATYALCGFANFSSIGIQVGGISALAPGRRADLAKLGLRAMFAGALASWTTATIAGLLI